MKRPRFFVAIVITSYSIHYTKLYEKSPISELGDEGREARIGFGSAVGNRSDTGYIRDTGKKSVRDFFARGPFRDSSRCPFERHGQGRGSRDVFSYNFV